MSTYTLYKEVSFSGSPFYTIGNNEKYVITALTKEYIEKSIKALPTATECYPNVIKLATFTTWDDLITNYPELLL